MKVVSLVVGALATNCYIVYNEETKQAAIIDPGDEEQRIAAKLKELSLTPEVILLTHGHFDHCKAARRLKAMYGIDIVAGKQEVEVLKDPRLNLSESFSGLGLSLTADKLVDEGEVLSVAGYEATVIFTPGHTKGGICFYFAKQGVLFSGDTLFCESLGRTDFPGGSIKELLISIIRRLFALPDETVVYPGHNEPTTIGYERENNPVVPYIPQIMREG